MLPVRQCGIKLLFPRLNLLKGEEGEGFTCLGFVVLEKRENAHHSFTETDVVLRRTDKTSHRTEKTNPFIREAETS